MCSPSGPSNTGENNSASAVGLINSNTQPSTSLQSNQQEPISDNPSNPNSDSVSLTQMPLPSLNRNRAITQEMSSKAYTKQGDALLIAGQDRLVSSRMQPSSSPQRKYSSHLFSSTSPNSTSTDIWAAPNSIPNTVSPISPPDYLRDIDEVLTPCTTLSTVPSRTPSEDDSEDPWRSIKKQLEIPDLDHKVNNMKKSTFVARQPINPYNKKVGEANRIENPKILSPTTLNRQRHPQSRSIEAIKASKETLRSSREASDAGSDRRNMLNSPSSTLQKAASANREARHSYAKEYYDQSLQVLSPTSNSVQGQHFFHQSPQTPQRHHRVSNSQNIPRSPYSYKYHHSQPQSWSHSPQHSHSGQRNNPHSSPQGSKHSHGHGQHQKSHQSSVNGASGTSGCGARPTYEILKTLLRKKACLYEPGTSKAIALITWLVGRKLALSHGYFSRQHLQSGVHAVVSDKIDSAMITRTKVNRCMQIILNSCFHYIIPRPDGTEEKGDLFRDSFASTVSDDSYLLQTLSYPWNDLEVTEDCLVEKEDMKEKEEESIKDKGGSKRIVLLCFNENVRSAEDVLRCHNDFIRDAAISGKLHLSADEWRQFYSLKDGESTKSSVSPSSPILKPKNGCDVPYLTFVTPQEQTKCLDNKGSIPEPWGRSADVLGQMNSTELNKFRTTWCCKRYDHDHSMCRFAHGEENQGWLRRDTSIHEYEEKMCPHVTIIKSSSNELKGVVFNACPQGVNCKYSHSQEEIDYHPNRYKSKICDSTKPTYHNCTLRDICSKCHPENPRSPVHKSGRSNYPKRSGDVSTKGKTGHTVNAKNSDASALVSENHLPSPAPIIYHKPAPPSEFEKTLMFPGLQSLYRRNSAMCYAHNVSKKGMLQKYNNFGDNWEDAEDLVEINEINCKSFSLYSTIGGK